MKPLQYWIDISECVCDSTLPIGGCHHCDLVEFQKRYDKALEALKAEHKVTVGYENDMAGATEHIPDVCDVCTLIYDLEEVK